MSVRQIASGRAGVMNGRLRGEGTAHLIRIKLQLRKRRRGQHDPEFRRLADPGIHLVQLRRSLATQHLRKRAAAAAAISAAVVLATSRRGCAVSSREHALTAHRLALTAHRLARAAADDPAAELSADAAEEGAHRLVARSDGHAHVHLFAARHPLQREAAQLTQQRVLGAAAEDAARHRPAQNAKRTAQPACRMHGRARALRARLLRTFKLICKRRAVRFCCALCAVGLALRLVLLLRCGRRCRVVLKREWCALTHAERRADEAVVAEAVGHAHRHALARAALARATQQHARRQRPLPRVELVRPTGKLHHALAQRRIGVRVAELRKADDDLQLIVQLCA
eukprot:5909615-Pleurochrysis_carterae.AAC.2